MRAETESNKRLIIQTTKDDLYDQIKYEKIKINNSSYYLVPLEFTDEKNKVWKYKAHGNYNAVFFYYGDGEDKDPTLVYKEPLDEINTLDDPRRIVRISQQLNPEKKESYSTYRSGSISLFIKHIKPKPDEKLKRPEKEILASMLDIFDKYNRVILDISTDGNYLVTHDGDVVHPDVGFALDLEKSQESLDAWQEYTDLYIRFLNNKEFSLRICTINTFTQALIVLSVLKLKLKNLHDLADYKNWETVKALASIFNSRETVSFTPSDLFIQPDTNDKLEAIRLKIAKLNEKFQLSEKEMQWVRLNPKHTFLYWLSYLNFPLQSRERMLFSSFNERKFYFMWADIILGGGEKPFSEHGVQFNLNLKRDKIPFSKGERLFALVYLIEEQKLTPENARQQLYKLSIDAVTMLHYAYRYGLRKEHFPDIKADIAPERRENIIAILEMQHMLPEDQKESYNSLLSKPDPELISICEKMRMESMPADLVTDTPLITLLPTEEDTVSYRNFM